MSAMTSGATARAHRVPVPAGRTRALRLVPQRRSSAARAPFVAFVVVLLVSGLLGLLMLNTMVAQDAFGLHDLTVQGKSLDDREQALSRQVQTLQAPTSLSQRATALGMVPGGPPMFLRLADGAVLGAVGAPVGSSVGPAPVPPTRAPVLPIRASVPPTRAQSAPRPVPATPAARPTPAAASPGRSGRATPTTATRPTTGTGR